MNTLREIGTFVGEAHVSMRRVGEIVPLLTSAQRNSMRAMILGLQNLPPIGLEVGAVGDRFGEVPFAPKFLVHPSGGVILETRMSISQNGPQPGKGLRVSDSGEVAPFTLNYVGICNIDVERIGITSTGITHLHKDFAVEGTPKPPPAPVPPVIAVQSKGDGSFVVSGSGFLATHQVTIRIVDGAFGKSLVLTSTSDAAGKLLDFPTGKICKSPGQLFFSANDGRLDPPSHDLFSNTVTVSCPS